MDLSNLDNNDPFQEADQVGFNQPIHLRIQKRNGRKSITIIEGLLDLLDNNIQLPSSKQILKTFKKNLSCNGSIKDSVYQLSGDQRMNIRSFLIHQLKIESDTIHIHGGMV